jgi:hypothetical protein
MRVHPLRKGSVTAQQRCGISAALVLGEIHGYTINSLVEKLQYPIVFGGDTLIQFNSVPKSGVAILYLRGGQCIAYKFAAVACPLTSARVSLLVVSRRYSNSPRRNNVLLGGVCNGHQPFAHPAGRATPASITKRHTN